MLVGADVRLDIDPYAVLGLTPDASARDIARARRRLSRKYHPDVNRDPGAAERFSEVQRAAELLSDPAARTRYGRAGDRGSPAAAPDWGTQPAPGVFAPPAPADSGTTAACRRSAAGRRAAFALYCFMCLFVGFLLVAVHLGGGPAPAPEPPPPRAVEVPQSAGAPLGVRPVFTVSAEVKYGDPLDGILAAPAQRGSELIVTAGWLPDPGQPPCVDIEVPGQYTATAGSGGNYSEAAVQTVPSGQAGGEVVEELVFPAVLPGRYILNPDCALGPPASSQPTLGSVAVKSLGVSGGSEASLGGNGMAVYSAHMSPAGMVLTYGAIGGIHDGSFSRPADHACIDGSAGGNPQQYWQPSRVLVSQRVAGKYEWFETGTMIFRSAHRDKPQGWFYYDCQDVPQGLPGVSLPG